jgi:MFS family permease
MLPVLAVQTFHNATLLGICLTAFGGSATLAAVGFAWLARYLTRSMIYYGGLALGGLAIAVCGIVTQRWGVVLGSALAGLAVGAGNPLEQTILQQVTPRAIAGQVFTALGAIRFGAGPFGLLAAGIATEWFGPAAVLLTGGVFLAGVALLGWRASPLPNSKA